MKLSLIIPFLAISTTLHAQIFTPKDIDLSAAFNNVNPAVNIVIDTAANTTGAWQNLGDFTDDNGSPERNVIDCAASESSKFYNVEITKP